MVLSTTSIVVEFLREIGIPVRFESISEATFLPGLTIRNGELVVDESQLTYPGDMLHEAGHIAMLEPATRGQTSAPIDPDLGMEIGAIAWSWAALQHLRLDPKVVFHEGGYRGGSAAFIANFSTGHTAGVPLLEWMGMTTTRLYPRMTHWLRQ